MISKDEARNKLKKAGYNVVDDNSILTVIISKDESVKNTVKKVKELFAKMEYNASFGVKQHTDAGSFENGELDDTIEMDSLDQDVAGGNDDVSFDNSDINDTTLATKEDKTDENIVNDSTEEFWDDEDDGQDLGSSFGELDMDMLLNEDNVQFSLEDFGMLS